MAVLCNCQGCHVPFVSNILAPMVVKENSRAIEVVMKSGKMERCALEEFGQVRRDAVCKEQGKNVVTLICHSTVESAIVTVWIALRENWAYFR